MVSVYKKPPDHFKCLAFDLYFFATDALCLHTFASLSEIMFSLLNPGTNLSLKQSMMDQPVMLH